MQKRDQEARRWSVGKEKCLCQSQGGKYWQETELRNSQLTLKKLYHYYIFYHIGRKQSILNILENTAKYEEYFLKSSQGLTTLASSSTDSLNKSLLSTYYVLVVF